MQNISLELYFLICSKPLNIFCTIACGAMAIASLLLTSYCTKRKEYSKNRKNKKKEMAKNF